MKHTSDTAFLVVLTDSDGSTCVKSIVELIASSIIVVASVLVLLSQEP